MKTFKRLGQKLMRSLIGLPPVLDKATLQSYIRPFYREAGRYLSLSKVHGSPLYVLDDATFRDRAKQFTDAFGVYFDDFKAYLAVKCNHHPALADAAIDSGLGLDVSSGVELEMAIACGCNDILFSGPGKTDPELALAAQHPEKVIVLIDSRLELERLERLARQQNVQIRCGVRLCTEEKGLWRKFGISPSSLEDFLKAATQYDHIRITGLQFHTSWNRDPGRQTAFIQRLGIVMRSMDPGLLSTLQFIDIGGGYWPQRGEWVHFGGTPQGHLFQSLGIGLSFLKGHYAYKAAGIDRFAKEISDAIKDYIIPILPITVKAEPGRWLCDDAMHILLTVVDKKSNDLVVTDGGMNSVGWERFETDYAPVINLSRPSETEHACWIFGSLCTPHDIWGYNYFGNGIEPGDILLIPGQGAYTYSLRQNFIKALPKVAKICR